MNISETIQKNIDLHNRILENTLLLQRIEEAISIIIHTYKNNRKLFLCGNGGSAADAQHIAAELTGRFYFDRPPLQAEALHCNTSYLTAVANDYGYVHIFSRLLEASAQEGDLLLVFSTSGNSANIIHAVDYAKENGIKVIAFTGDTGGKLATLSDLLINVPSHDTPRIQEAHILIGHIICEQVEQLLFAKK